MLVRPSGRISAGPAPAAIGTDATPVTTTSIAPTIPGSHRTGRRLVLVDVRSWLVRSVIMRPLLAGCRRSLDASDRGPETRGADLGTAVCNFAWPCPRSLRPRQGRRARRSGLAQRLPHRYWDAGSEDETRQTPIGRRVVRTRYPDIRSSMRCRRVVSGGAEPAAVGGRCRVRLRRAVLVAEATERPRPLCPAVHARLAHAETLGGQGRGPGAAGRRGSPIPAGCAAGRRVGRANHRSGAARDGSGAARRRRRRSAPRRTRRPSDTPAGRSRRSSPRSSPWRRGATRRAGR